MKRIKVVAAYIEKDGNILIAQRLGGEYDGMWEFPGGKVEVGETWEGALIREIKEEMGIDIEVEDFIEGVQHPYTDLIIDLRLYRAKHVTGDITLRNHKQALLIDKRLILDYTLVPADIALVNKIGGYEYSHRHVIDRNQKRYIKE